MLKHLVDSRRLTRDETRTLLRTQAKTLGMTDFSIERRQFDRWLTGQLKTRPHPAACRVLEAVFGYPVEVLLAPATAQHPDPRRNGRASYQPNGAASPHIDTDRPHDPQAAVAALTAAVRELAQQAEHLAVLIAAPHRRCSSMRPAAPRDADAVPAGSAESGVGQPLGGEQPPSATFDTSVAHSARVWNYWLGGNDNFAIDRIVGDQILEVMPQMRNSARACRAFLVRAVQYLVGEVGIRQFLDLGCGLPTATDIHDVAQSVTPESKVVYVDNDPLVMAHARALLVGQPLSVTDHIEADVRDFDTVQAQAARTLDWTEPVAVIMAGILGHIVDDHEAQSLIGRIISAVSAGSYLVISDTTNATRSQQRSETERMWDEDAEPPYRLRTPDQIARFFDGLELVEPGVVSATRWRPDPVGAEPPVDLDNFVGVGRKPSGTGSRHTG